MTTKEHQWMSSSDPAAMLAMIPNASERKLRLWVEACRVKEDEKMGKQYGRYDLSVSLSTAVRCWSKGDSDSNVPVEIKCDLLREIFGNPFRSKQILIVDSAPFGPSRSVPNPITIQPHWLTSAVVSLAHTIYDENAWEIMPVLGDALQDGGCEDQEIIDHAKSVMRCTRCSGEGCSMHGMAHGGCDGSGDVRITHVLGCWLIDLIRGEQ